MCSWISDKLPSRTVVSISVDTPRTHHKYFSLCQIVWQKMVFLGNVLKKWKKNIVKVYWPFVFIYLLELCFFSIGIFILFIVFLKFFVGMSFTFLYKVQSTLKQYRFELCGDTYTQNFSVSTVQHCKWIFYSLWFSY